MKCPHCLVGLPSQLDREYIARDKNGEWEIEYKICPECKNIMIYLDEPHNFSGQIMNISRMVYPEGITRKPLPTEINDEEIVEDYKEACLVLADSPKASAALSRRCLQHLLREKAEVKKATLAEEIQQVLDSRQLPSYLSESLDAIRNIGKFAAHPIKSKSSGEIVDVEDGEAEWNLDVLEGLFDFYYVQPAILKKKKEELNKKLTDAGKPPMK
jgi:hypothetical protein